MTTAARPAAVTTAQHGRVVVIRLDDGKVNALNETVLHELRHALDDASSSDAVVITGRPGVLSAGLDRSVMLTGDRNATAGLKAAASGFFAGLITASQPLVIASHGHALAAGAVLLLAGDARVGSTTPARIGLNELAVGVALPPLAIAMARARLNANVLWQATTGAHIYDSISAVTAGFLDVREPPDRVLEVALERAEALAALPRRHFLAARASLWGPAIRESGLTP